MMMGVNFGFSINIKHAQEEVGDEVISLLFCLRQIKSVVIAGAESRVTLWALSLPRLVSGRV